MARPDPSEYREYQAAYVSLVPETKVIPILESQPDLVRAFARTVPADRETFAYAAGKWTIRQVVGHITDAERVFGYRLFCIHRGDRTSFPPFDENAYVDASDANSRELRELADEFALVRETNLTVLRRLSGDDWKVPGVVNGALATPRAVAFVMAGHVRHHMKLFAERYGVSLPPQ